MRSCVVKRDVKGLRPVGHLAEHEELALALRARVVEHVGRELLPELVVDVLHRVDAEAVDGEVADPALVDLDHPLDYPRVLREEVVEAEEVAVERVLAREGRVAAVVVERHVVEPGGRLVSAPAGYERACRGSSRPGPAAGKRSAREVAVVERLAGGRPVGLAVLRDVAGAGRPR